jgi:hypothetical protein
VDVAPTVELCLRRDLLPERADCRRVSRVGVAGRLVEQQVERAVTDADRRDGRRELVTLAAAQRRVRVRPVAGTGVVVGDDDRVVAGVLRRLDLLREEAATAEQDDDLLLARTRRQRRCRRQRCATGAAEAAVDRRAVDLAAVLREEIGTVKPNSPAS